MAPADKSKLDGLPGAWTELTDTADTITAGGIVQANAAGDALEFNNTLDGGII